MDTVKARGERLFKAFMALCLASVMAFGMASVAAVAAPGKAYAANQKVLDQRSGVFKFNWGINGEEYARGSAFLINDDTVVTAYHCVMPSAWELERLGMNMQAVQDQSTYTVTIAGDFQVSASLEKVSEKQDFAILKLDQKLSGTTALKLRNSSDVDASEVVYSMGFPGVADQNAVVTFTSNDVSVIDGTVSKPEGQMKFTTNTHQECEGSFMMTTCRIDNGTSGGPMVDADGNVVGVCVASDQSFYYAAASDILMEALKTMNYKYSEATASSGGTGSSSSSSSAGSASSSTSAKTYSLNFDKLNSAVSSAEALDSAEYTADSYKALSAALAEAKEAQGLKLDDDTDKSEYDKKQGEIDDAAKALTTAQNNLAQAEKGLPMAAIIGIVVAIVAVIVIVVLVLVMRSRKKKNEEQAPTVPLGTPSAPLGGGASGATQQPAGAIPATTTPTVAETTILDEEASDTVILFQAASGGSLTRMSTNEQIPINSAEFTIGRERSKVNYCLEGNSSISRVHVRIVVRDGKVFLVDNKAANGTFVNGVKARPGQEIELKSGDIITLADEKFKYNA